MEELNFRLWIGKVGRMDTVLGALCVVLDCGTSHSSLSLESLLKKEEARKRIIA